MLSPLPRGDRIELVEKRWKRFRSGHEVKRETCREREKGTGAVLASWLTPYDLRLRAVRGAFASDGSGRRLRCRRRRPRSGKSWRRTEESPGRGRPRPARPSPLPAPRCPPRARAGRRRSAPRRDAAYGPSARGPRLCTRRPSGHGGGGAPRRAESILRRPARQGPFCEGLCAPGCP